jgi:hypothetical protein
VPTEKQMVIQKAQKEENIENENSAFLQTLYNSIVQAM